MPIPSARTAVKGTIQASLANAPPTGFFMAPNVSHRFPFLQPRPYTEYMNYRGCETRDATGQSRVAREPRTVWSRFFAAVLPNNCPAWQRGSLSCDGKGRMALNRSWIVFRAAFLASSRACTSSSSVATSVSVEILASNAISCSRSDCRSFL